MDNHTRGNDFLQRVFNVVPAYQIDGLDKIIACASAAAYKNQPFFQYCSRGQDGRYFGNPHENQRASGQEPLQHTPL